MTGDKNLGDISERLIRTFEETVNRYPSGYTQFLCAVDYALGPVQEIVVAGEPDGNDTHAMLKEIRKHFLPRKIVLLHSEKDTGIEEISGFTKECKAVDNKTTVYMCENYSCKAPVNDVSQLLKLLKKN
jgi:uncharacterized protein YyaL (SSP411 family)